jgi:hypothetical protein
MGQPNTPVDAPKIRARAIVLTSSFTAGTRGGNAVFESQEI